MAEYLEDFGKRLLSITRDCRDDMHEPDEQGISASVVGTELDNAMGDSGHAEEMIVLLKREVVTNWWHKKERFNLATLIAFARIGAKTIQEEPEKWNIDLR